ncbi:MAG: SurA N-terminal domain-containing protein [Tepidamorphaceae bacterium]
MLDALRRGAGTWVAKVFLGLLVFSFAIWGIADIFRGYRGDTLITVGKTEISGEQFRYELQTDMQQYGRQLGRPLTLPEARALGIDGQVLGRLISQAALDEKAREMGLHMSDAAVAKAITEDPQFQTPGGQFDRSYFEQVLRATGLNEARYVATKRREMLRQAIGSSLTGGGLVSQTLRDAVNTYSNETRSLDYFVIGNDSIDPVGEPDEETLAKYFESNKAQFAAPEYRKLSVISVDPASLAETIDITEDEARQEYESRIDRYQTPEKRTVRQIVFADKAEAEAALAEINAGKSFDDIAQARGLKPGETDLGTVAKSDIIDSTVADAAFTLEKDKVSDVIEGQFGYVLALVTDIQPGSTRSFEEARDDIIKILKLLRAETAVLDLYDEVEDARAAGQTLSEIAAAKKLKLIVVDAVDSRGNGPDGNPVKDLPAAQELVREAFQSDIGLENDPLQLRGTQFIWYDVTDITPARERTLDEVRERVVTAWKETQEKDHLQKTANEAVEAINGGEPVTAVAAKYGRSVTTAKGLKRTDTSGPAGSAAIQRLFLLAEGAAAQTPAANADNRIVIVMTGSEVPPADPDSDTAKTIVDRLKLARSNDILGQYVGGLRTELGVEVNPELLKQVLGETTN